MEGCELLLFATSRGEGEIGWISVNEILVGIWFLRCPIVADHGPKHRLPIRTWVLPVKAHEYYQSRRGHCIYKILRRDFGAFQTVHTFLLFRFFLQRRECRVFTISGESVECRVLHQFNSVERVYESQRTCRFKDFYWHNGKSHVNSILLDIYNIFIEYMQSF